MPRRKATTVEDDAKSDNDNDNSDDDEKPSAAATKSPLRRSTRKRRAVIPEPKLYQAEKSDTDDNEGTETEERESSSKDKKEPAKPPKKGKATMPKKRQSTDDDDDGEEEEQPKQLDEEEDDQEDTGSDAEESDAEELPPRKKRRSSPPKKTTKKAKSNKEEEQEQSDEAEDDEKDDTESEEADSDAEPLKPPPRKKRRLPQKKKAAPKKRKSKEEELKCPHCDRIFTTKNGLVYHVDHYVCRQSIRPGGPVQKGRRKVTKPKPKQPPQKQQQRDEKQKEEEKPAAASTGQEGGPAKKYKRFRGAEEDRVCKLCNRVFTSVLGLNYHVANKVCIQKKKSSKPFYTLKPGERFITRFGIVEVVHDNRATPVAEFPAKVKDLSKRWTSSRLKRELQVTKAAVNVAVRSLTRRIGLGALYSSDKLSQESVFGVYFGKNPKLYATSELGKNAVMDPLRPDPAAPADSFPDRIVVCQLVPDERKCLWAEHDEDLRDALCASREAMPGMRLYLRRRELTEQYIAGSDMFKCADCGQHFTSITGCKYHVKGTVCRQAKSKVQEHRGARLTTVETRARRLMQHGQASVLNYQQLLQQRQRGNRSATKKLTRRQTRQRRVKDPPIYPQIFISMGFKFLAKTDKPVTVSAFRPRGAPRSFNKGVRTTEPPAAVKNDEEEEVDANDAAATAAPQPMTLEQYTQEQTPAPVKTTKNKVAAAASSSRKKVAAAAIKQQKKKKEEEVVHPDDVLAQLYADLRWEQSKWLGPVYPRIFKSLGFRRAGDKKNDTSSDDDDESEDEEETFAKPPPNSSSNSITDPPPLDQALPQAVAAGSTAEEPPPLDQAMPQALAIAELSSAEQPPPPPLDKAMPQAVAIAELSSTEQPPPPPLDQAMPQTVGAAGNSAEQPPPLDQAMPESLAPPEESEEATDTVPRKRRRRGAAEELPEKPLPPMVDVMVLIAEIENGRYPTIHVGRIAPDDPSRMENCNVCGKKNPKAKRTKDGRNKKAEEQWKGTRFCCSVCPNVFHWKCLRTRHTVKTPEPGEPVMCSTCIGMISSRRQRAEKRRLEKKQDGRGGAAHADDCDDDDGDVDDGEEDEDAAQNKQDMELLVNETIVPGREYESVAAQTRQIAELTILAKDTQLRLGNALEVAKINNRVRRGMLAPLESQALF